jgi:hypothetical protein
MLRQSQWSPNRKCLRPVARHGFRRMRQKLCRHQGYHDHDRHLPMIMIEPTRWHAADDDDRERPLPVSGDDGDQQRNHGQQRWRPEAPPAVGIGWGQPCPSHSTSYSDSNATIRTGRHSRGDHLSTKSRRVAAQSPVPHDRHRRWSGGDRSTGRMLPAKPHRFSHGSCRAI